MIGILGGMGTQAGLDLCNKLSMLYRGKSDQEYPKFILYNKSDIPKRPENLKKYYNVLNELVRGCKLLQRNKCSFIVMPCNTAHYWYDDLKKKIRLPIINMPEEVFNYAKKFCKKNSSIGLLATEGTIKTGVYKKFFNHRYKLIHPNVKLQKNSVNKAIKFVKMGKVKAAAKIIKPAIDYLIKNKCSKIILGCTELPIAIFAFKSFKKIENSKIFFDPNLILAKSAMKKYKI